MTAAAVGVLNGVSLLLPLLLKSGVIRSGLISHAGRTTGGGSATRLPESGTTGLDSRANTIVAGPAQAGFVCLPLALRAGSAGGTRALCGRRPMLWGGALRVGGARALASGLECHALATGRDAT